MASSRASSRASNSSRVVVSAPVPTAAATVTATSGAFDEGPRDSSAVCFISPSVGGRLRSCWEFWETLSPTQYITDIVNQGHILPFLSHPPRFMGVRHTPLRGMREKREALLSEIQQLLQKRAIEPVPTDKIHQGWYGNYFLVPKKSGGWRPILNLRPLNKMLRVDSFKMESLKNVVLAVQPGEWLASLDLQDAYFHVPVHVSHKKFLSSRCRDTSINTGSFRSASQPLPGFSPRFWLQSCHMSAYKEFIFTLIWTTCSFGLPPQNS
jgi:hypothetical protein